MHRLVLRIGKKRVAWLCDTDLRFAAAWLLPWALRDKDWAFRTPEDTSPVDFMVAIHWPFVRAQVAIATPPPKPLPPEFLEFQGPKFTLAGEPFARGQFVPEAWEICTGRDPADHDHVRYGPVMGPWCPPLETNKRLFWSVIDSGKWPWRLQRIKEIAKTMSAGEGHAFGRCVNSQLPGYHNFQTPSLFGQDKYRGLADYAFHLAIESFPVSDYWTEKIADPIMCEAVPIYQGCPNIADYFEPDSYILAEDAARVDWTQWPAEYAKRRPAVLRQRELIRTRFNFFSYFDVLTDDLSRLTKPQPLTRF